MVSATGSTIAAGATIDLNGQSISEPFTSVSGYGVGGQGAFVNTSATEAKVLGRITGGGSYVVGGSGNIVLAAQTGGGTITKNGSGTLTIGTVKDTADNDSVALVLNAGRVVLAKPSTTTIHALGGTSTVNGGILQLAGTGPDQLFYGMTLRLNGGLLDLNGFNGVVSTLISETPTVAGTVANNATGVSTFTVGGNANGGNGNSTFFGQFVDRTGAGTGQLRLEKDGTGTFNLAAAATYTGGTAVTRGTLNIGANGYVGSLVGDVAVAAGATLGLNRMDDFAFANAVSGAGSLAVNGSGLVTVSGASAFT
jgi:autotransporter-associated beta strand protein